MKTISLVILWIYCLAYLAFADRTINIAWNPNPETDLAGYHVFINGVKQPLTKFTVATITIPDTETVLTAIAINNAGIEGPQSAALIIPALPPKPPVAVEGMRVVVIEDSSNLREWKPVAMIPLMTDDPARFIRASLATLPPTPTP